ncbi:MAG: hypothetical protein GJU76_13765 [Gallionella sp.]|jgi:hypothetical protein|nr:hypothetical protein [Gallionella sp.]
MVVIAEAVEKVEERVGGPGPVFPVVRLKSCGDAASLDSARRIEEVEGRALMAARSSPVVVDADDLLVVAKYSGDEGVPVGGKSLDC